MFVLASEREPSSAVSDMPPDGRGRQAPAATVKRVSPNAQVPESGMSVTLYPFTVAALQ